MVVQFVHVLKVGIRKKLVFLGSKFFWGTPFTEIGQTRFIEWVVHQIVRQLCDRTRHTISIAINLPFWIVPVCFCHTFHDRFCS